MTSVIDAHGHLLMDHPDLVETMAGLGVRTMNICVDSAELGGLAFQRAFYRDLIARHPERFAWCTSFSSGGFDPPGYADGVIAQIDEDLAAGAIAVKVWKNVGMEIKDNAGRFVFVDDLRYRPIFDHLERRGVPLLMHIGEPLACWRPLDPDCPHYGYYSHAPQWHLHGRTDYPSHADLIASRDRLVERHPKLTAIGAHFGSLEYDLAEVAARFERFPNFYVDTSARLGDVARAARRDHDATRAFFVRFADRILWGVDLVMTRAASALNADQLKKWTADLKRVYDLERRFYTTGDHLLITNKPVRGLALPADVLERLMGGTARRVYPGL